MARENEEKGFQKYIGFYWLKKAQERELRRRTKAKTTIYGKTKKERRTTKNI